MNAKYKNLTVKVPYVMEGDAMALKCGGPKSGRFVPVKDLGSPKRLTSQGYAPAYWVVRA